ncbi:MAG: FecR family protein [Methylobacter sp.]|nr:FecR family protein [Methylobacter sp.]
MNESAAEISKRLEQTAIAWHTRLTSGEVSTDERAEFDRWLQQNPAHQQAYRQIEKLWQLLDAPLQADRQNRLAKQVNATVQTSKQPACLTTPLRQHRWGVGLAIAASLLLAVTFTFFPDYLNHPGADYHTRIGEQTSITLADGSIVHLNTDTALDVNLSDHERRIVLLHGEAEFEVAHDSNRPFRVATGDTTTEALGTRFVVRYNSRQGSVTLLQGEVRTTGVTSGSVTLQTGQYVSFDSQKLSAIQAIDLNSANAWRRGRIIMNFVPLKQAIAEINRYRRSPIKLIAPNLADKEINIAVDIQHIDAWLDSLKNALPVRVYRLGPLVMVDS